MRCFGIIRLPVPGNPVAPVAPEGPGKPAIEDGIIMKQLHLQQSCESKF